MKIVKLLGILVIFVAIILGIIYLPGIINPQSDDNFISKDLVNINDIRDEFVGEWEEIDTWDATLHQKQHEKVLRWKNNKMLSKDGYVALTNLIREMVINKVCNGYYNALASTTYNHRNIITNYNYIQDCKKAEGLDNTKNVDNRISKVEALHKYYRNVKAFAESSHTLKPDLKIPELTWRSFDSLKNNKISTASNYRNNAFFSKVKHIDIINNGLKESEVVRKTELNRGSFYESLYLSIEQYFDSEEVSAENLDRLNNVRNGGFKIEAPTMYRDMLMDYILKYEDRLKEKEHDNNY